MRFWPTRWLTRCFPLPTRSEKYCKMSETQRDGFIHGEGDRYFQRNRDRLIGPERLIVRDPVLRLFSVKGTIPSSILEVGCSNGWRLSAFAERGAEKCMGIDPSAAAINEGLRSFPNLDLRVGTAETLPFASVSVDLVIYGFCLYVCDPSDHLRIVAEGDRVLKDGGQIAIFDFDPPQPYRNPYTYKAGLYSYKMDFSRLFLAHPHYTVCQKYTEGHGGTDDHKPDNRVAVTVLRKDMKSAWPENPWANVK